MVVGFTCGVFDMFHAGHVYMLQECKQHCDHLIVALNTAENFSEEVNPGKKRPIYTIEQRKLIMENCKLVDEVLTYSSEEELLEVMKGKKIDVRFLGDDYKGKPITGAELSAQIYYTNRSHGLSTSKYREIIAKLSK